MKRILVTGAGGYIGRHIVQELCNKGHQVIAVDFNLNTVDQRSIRLEQNIFEIDETFLCGYDRPEILIHLAWRDGFIHNSDAHLTDLPKHIKFVEQMVELGVNQVIVMGTMHEIGYHEGMVDENTPCNPQSFYGIAKNALRQALNCSLKDSGVILQWARAFYIYGDDKMNHSVFTKIAEKEEAGEKSFPFVTGNNKYDFIDVDELANQIASIAIQKKVIGCINCCTGNPLSLKEMAEKYIKDNAYNIKLEVGAFPDRPYDSPIIYGSRKKIERVYEVIKNEE